MELLSVPTDIQPSDAVAEERPSRLSDALSARSQSARLMRTHSARSSTLGERIWVMSHPPESSLRSLSTYERADDDRPEQYGCQYQHPDPAPQDVVVGQQGFPRLTHDIVEETELKGDGHD